MRGSTCYLQQLTANILSLQTAAECYPCHTNTHPDAQNAAPATTSATASPKCCACHDFARPPPRARQHPVPLDSRKFLPLPHKHTPRCTECCACHDFGNGIAKVLRLPRFRMPPAVRAPTSCPFRQPQNSAPATQTHTQMHRMLRLPRLRQWHLQSACLPRFRTPHATRATTSCPVRQLPNAAPATISHAPCRARDNNTPPDAQNAAPATTSAMASPKCCACHDFARPPPRARQHPVPLDSCRMLRLPRFRTPRAARATTSCPFRQLPNAAPATQTHTQMHRMLRLPRLRQWHRQSAAPATVSHAPRRARDNILSR